VSPKKKTGWSAPKEPYKQQALTINPRTARPKREVSWWLNAKREGFTALATEKTADLR